MSAPDTVGHYRLLRRLAVGGMAEVFLAEETAARGLARQVVIKRMLPHLAAEDRFREMFVREARTQARVGHPNVVQVYELGEEDGLPYIAMELVAGTTLRDLLATARAEDLPLPVPVVVDVACQAAAAAHAVHELTDGDGVPLGLVHRDLTPHNLMITPSGFVKLLDFGIVKGARDDKLTETGVLKGKLAYLAPEQIEQLDVDRRADVFALGAVTWEMLAGEKLFQGQNEVAVLRSILAGEVRPLAHLRPDVPDAIVRAVHRAVATDRNTRWPTAEAFRRALLEAAESSAAVPRRDDTAATVVDLLARRAEATGAPVPSFTSPTNPETIRPAVTRTVSVVERHAPVVGVLGLAALLLGLGALGMAGWMFARPDPDAGEPYVPPTGEPVPVVLAPVSDPAQMTEDLELLRRYLERALDRPVPLTVADDYGEAVDAIVGGDAMLAVVPPGAYLAARREHPEIVALLSEVVDGSRGSDGVLVTREGEEIDAGRLRGATVCYADPDSTTGHHLARAWLREAGLDPDADVTARFSGNHLQVLRDLLAGECLVAATYTAGWTAADQAGVPVSRTRLVATTGWTPNDVVVAGPGTSEVLRAAVVEALSALDPERDLGVPRIGERERITGFAPIDEEALAALDARLHTSGAAP